MKVSKYYSIGDYSVSLDIEFDPKSSADLIAAYSILDRFAEGESNADTEPSVECDRA